VNFWQPELTEHAKTGKVIKGNGVLPK